MSGKSQPPPEGAYLASLEPGLINMSVAELTVLINDAQAALSRKEERLAQRWWTRPGQKPGPE